MRSHRTYEINYLKKAIILISVTCILIPLCGCTFSAKLYYRPITESSIAGARQGYSDYQIDENTFLVIYQGQLGNPAEYWAGVYDLKWIKIAQQYVLYRAGEVAKSRGSKYVLVLHKDDWNLVGVDPYAGKYGPYRRFEPGAGIVVRVLKELPSSIERSEDRVLDVEQLLQNRIEKNSGLAEYSSKAFQSRLSQNGNDEFRRWRSSVNRFDSAPIPISRHKNVFGSEYIEFEPGTKIVPQAVRGQLELAIWDHELIHPLQFLAECVKIADQEGFEAFKLGNWTAEEYCTGGQYDTARRPECRKIWFRTKATIILQRQKELGSLDPVFAVNEIRANISNAGIKP